MFYYYLLWFITLHLSEHPAYVNYPNKVHAKREEVCLRSYKHSAPFCQHCFYAQQQFLTHLQTPAWISAHWVGAPRHLQLNAQDSSKDKQHFKLFLCCLYWRRELWLGEEITRKALLKSNPSPDKNRPAAAGKTHLGFPTFIWWLLQHHKPTSKSIWRLKALKRHSWKVNSSYSEISSPSRGRGENQTLWSVTCKAEFLRSNRNWKHLGLMTGLLPLLL